MSGYVMTSSTPSSRDSFPLRLLSLDGGGIRGYSALLQLEELMLSLFFELHGRAPRTDEIPKPCEVFDMICGTGTGGILAILLGRLRLDIEQCKSQYAHVARQVFESDKTLAGIPVRKTLFKAANLEAAMRQLVKEAEGGGGDQTDASIRGRGSVVPSSSAGSLNGEKKRSAGRENYQPTFRKVKDPTKVGKLPSVGGGGGSGTSSPSLRSLPDSEALLYDPRPDRCKTFVTAVYKGSTSSTPPALLRTYESAFSPMPGTKIWEAGRATCAIAPSFKAIQIEHDVFHDEGAGRYSPVQALLAEALVHEFPGREVGVLISIGSGKKPSGAPRRGPKKIVEAHERRLVDAENVHQELLQGLGRAGVSRRNYYRLNVEVGVGDYGINEWSRMPEISTETRKYLTQPEVRSMVDEAARKMAGIAMMKGQVSEAGYRVMVFNRELPEPAPLSASPIPTLGSDHIFHQYQPGQKRDGKSDGYESFDPYQADEYVVSDLEDDEEVMAHLEQLREITRRMYEA